MDLYLVRCGPWSSQRMQKNQERSRMRKRITDNQPENLCSGGGEGGEGLGTKLLQYLHSHIASYPGSWFFCIGRSLGTGYSHTGHNQIVEAVKAWERSYDNVLWLAVGPGVVTMTL